MNATFSRELSQAHADRLADSDIAPVAVVLPHDVTENTRYTEGIRR